MTSTAELTGYARPLEDDDRTGFRIHMYRPRRITPPLFYTGLMILLGLDHCAPRPDEVEALQVESDGQAVHVELILTDGRAVVVDVPLDRGIRGFI